MKENEDGKGSAVQEEVTTKGSQKLPFVIK